MWGSDNAIFNVNGESLEKLVKTLELALDGKTVKGWKIYPDKGMCLYRYDSTSDKSLNLFPTSITASQAAQMVFQWLSTDEAKKIPCKDWDSDAHHDGHNKLGWRVYTEDWGHVHDDWNVVAIKPAYMWYGK